MKACRVKSSSRGECAEAIRDLEEVTLVTVDSPTYHFHLALAYQCGEDRDAARQAMQAAEEMGLKERDVAKVDFPAYTELKRWLAR